MDYVSRSTVDDENQHLGSQDLFIKVMKAKLATTIIKIKKTQIFFNTFRESKKVKSRKL